MVKLTFLLILAHLLLLSTSTLGRKPSGENATTNRTSLIETSAPNTTDIDPLTSGSVEEEIERTLKMLREGEAVITAEDRRDALVVLGVSGSGKSTIILLLAGDNSKLRAVREMGEMIIKDEGGKISNSTIISHTILPELVLDEETNNAFYDTPGFSDTRNASFDIAASFFINRLLVHATEVKLFFTIDHAFLRFAVSRDGFMRVLNHINELMNDIDKYKNSLSVVVTKIDNIIIDIVNGVPVFVPDEEIIQNIVKFMLDVKKDLENENANGGIDDDKFTLNRNRIKLIDIFTSQNSEGIYSRISIFKRPLQEGPLSEDLRVQADRTNIRHNLFNEIYFTKTDEKDFSNTISADSKLYIQSLIQRIVEEISKKSLQIVYDTNEFVLNKCKQSTDVYNLHQYLQSTLQILLESNACQHFLMDENVVKDILCAVEKIGYEIPYDMKTDVIDLLTFLNYFESFSDSNKYSLSNVVVVYNQLIDNFKRIDNWYVFILDLYKKLSEYEFLNEREKYNVLDVENWGISGHEQGLIITTQNVKIFLNKLERYSLREYNFIIRDENIELFFIRDMNLVLSITIKSVMTDESLNNKHMRFMGENILLNEVNKKVINMSMNYLEIFALNTVFIDEDIINNNETQVVIIGTDLNIRGNRIINLSGQNGEPLGKAGNGVFPGESGDTGKPGKPGKPSGSFMSVGRNYINGRSLSLFVKGGIGGKGEDGGDGNDGIDGKKPNFLCGSCIGFPSRALEAQNCSLKFIMQYREVYPIVLTVKLKVQKKWYIECRDGGVGGNGGDGGARGFGGKRGESWIFDLENKDSDIIVNYYAGDIGKLGAGGKYGRGGKELNPYRGTFVREGKMNYAEFKDDRSRGWYLVETDPGYCNKEECLLDTLPVTWQAYADNGKLGVDGENENGIEHPLNIREFKKGFAINAFKFFLRENFNSSIGFQIIHNLYDEIDTNFDIQDLFITIDFIDAIKGLEKQYRVMSVRLNILPFYNSLLAQIIRFGDSFDNDNNRMYLEDKIALNYVYATTLSRICVVKAGRSRNMIIDLDRFFDLAIKNVETMKELESSKVSQEIRDKYKESINKKIEEAYELIDLTINAEFKLFKEELDINIEGFLNEIEILIENAEAHREQLLDQREKLQQSIKYERIFGVLGIIGETLSMFGPYGKIAGAVISGSSRIAGSILVDTDVDPKDNTLYPKGIQNAIDKFQLTVDEMFKSSDNFRKELISINDMITDIPEIVILRQLIDKITAGLPNKDVLIKLVLMKQYSDEISKVATEEEAEINKNRAGKNSTAGQILGKIKGINVFANSVLDFYKKFKDSNKKLDELNNAIREMEKLIYELNAFHDSIYSKVIPMLRNLMKELFDVKDSLENSSHVALDVKKYEIQKFIREIKHEIEDITQGFDMEIKFRRTFSQLEDAANLMIQLYDRIQDYDEQEQFADYIAALISAKFRDFQQMGSKYQQSVIELELITASNSVIEQNNRAVSAFKQQIFPFANSYAHIFDRQIVREENQTLTDLTYLAVQQLNSLKSTYSEIKTTIVNGEDENIFTAEFDSKYNTSYPFYIWKNSQFKTQINGFLSGETLIIKSNIINSGQKNAIKFNLLELKFKSLDKNLQDELDSIITYFDIDMSHRGNSLYRCNNRFFIINSESQLISYSFKKNDQGIPIRRNNVYNKILSGDILLSPYTTWGLRLLNATSSVGFDALDKFKGKINLELSGRGQYVRPDASVCESPLELFYDVYEPSMSDLHMYALNMINYDHEPILEV